MSTSGGPTTRGAARIRPNATGTRSSRSPSVGSSATATPRRRSPRSRPTPASRSTRSTSPSVGSRGSSAPSGPRRSKARGPVPAEQRSDRMQASETDPRQILEGWGTLTAEVAPRVAPILLLIRDAATTDAEVRTLLDELDDDRLRRMRTTLAGCETVGTFALASALPAARTSCGPTARPSSTSSWSCAGAGPLADSEASSPTR